MRSSIAQGLRIKVQGDNCWVNHLMILNEVFHCPSLSLIHKPRAFHASLVGLLWRLKEIMWVECFPNDCVLLCNAGDHLQCWSWGPWVGKIPWRRKWQPAPIFLPGKSQGQRSLVDYSLWGHKELGTTERLKNNSNKHLIKCFKKWLPEMPISLFSVSSNPMETFVN